ncbi:MAG: hypothetical protein AB7Q37_06185 [Pyrinomonadaceae bacterium]
MKFAPGVAKKYHKSVNAAFDAILAHGTDLQKQIAGHILESEMLVRVAPVSELNASGITGLIDPDATNEKISEERLGIREALGEVFVAIAEETIDNGGQRGCEGTFVHEGRHAYDFARTIESFSNVDVNPLSIFDPTLYELELEAHKIAGDYMLCIDRDEYLHEGLHLMILDRDGELGPFFVSDEGIHRRLRESYALDPVDNPGPRASELLGLRLK